MDPLILDAQDEHRAPPASLRSPDMRRLIRLVMPHRRFIVVGLVAAILHGFLNSVGIIGMLPVLKIMLTEEGLHGWVHRTVAEKRLGARLDSALPDELDPSGPPMTVLVVSTRRQGLLAEAGVQAGEHITAFVLSGRVPTGSDLPSQPASEFFRTVAIAAPGAELTIAHRPPTDPTGRSTPAVLSLAPPAWHWRMLLRISALLPQEKQRSDRVVTLVYVLGVLVLIVVVSAVARFLAEYALSVGVLRGVMDLRRNLYRKVLRLPMEYFTQNTADLVARFVQDAQEIQRGLLALFGKLITEPIKAVFILGAALAMNARMTAAMLLIGPVAIGVFWVAGRKIRKANKRLLRSYGIMIGALSASLQAIGVVKAYNAEHRERKRLWSIDRRMFGQQVRLVTLEAFLRPLLEVLGVVGIAAVTVWLGAQVIQQRVRIEEFGALVIALAMLTDPLRKFADVYPRVMRSAAAARRVFAVADAPAEAELCTGAVELAALARGLEFQKVSFTYPGAPGPALRGVDLTINRGETVAIVGPNGSGKTTLTRLLIRFFDPQSGKVLFDGVDVRQASLRSLRRQFSVVTQDPVVFAMSIAENIAYGERRAEPEAVAAAARRAHAEEFILEKADGYDELIGESGSTLSGGQRQRLCIARAILRNAPILIFDEATSQIDSESERAIQQAVRDFSRDRTTIIIAHRLSTIRFARRVVVMDAGRVIDSGTHAELLERCDLYAGLCRSQMAE